MNSTYTHTCVHLKPQPTTSNLTVQPPWNMEGSEGALGYGVILFLDLSLVKRVCFNKEKSSDSLIKLALLY